MGRRHSHWSEPSASHRTLVERKSGYAVLSKVTNKTSDLVSNAIINELQSFAPLIKTMTFDNGKEFAEHQRIDKELQSTTYFADPFASWQRGEVALKIRTGH